MLDRLDDALEPLARTLTGKAQWDEMKENALWATEKPNGGVQTALKHLTALLKADPTIELHVVGHSAGSIFHAPLIKSLTDQGITVASCTLWAPACTIELFNRTYLPAIESDRIKRFALFTLTDEAEQADQCAYVYNKSLLSSCRMRWRNDSGFPCSDPMERRFSAWKSGSGGTLSSGGCLTTGEPTG
jgi:hypothetical protein